MRRAIPTFDIDGSVEHVLLIDQQPRLRTLLIGAPIEFFGHIDLEALAIVAINTGEVRPCDDMNMNCSTSLEFPAEAVLVDVLDASRPTSCELW